MREKQEKQVARAVSIARPSMIVVLLTCLDCMLSCVPSAGSPHQCDVEPGKLTYALRDVPVLSPLNFLAAEPWKLDTLTHVKAKAFLERHVTLQEGKYDLAGMCAQISQSTGRPVCWVPDVAPSDLRGPSFRVGRNVARISDKDGPFDLPADVCVGDVLNLIVAIATEIGAGPDMPITGTRVWVVVVQKNAILFVGLPRIGVGDGPAMPARQPGVPSNVPATAAPSGGRVVLRPGSQEGPHGRPELEATDSR